MSLSGLLLLSSAPPVFSDEKIRSAWLSSADLIAMLNINTSTEMRLHEWSSCRTYLSYPPIPVSQHRVEIFPALICRPLDSHLSRPYPLDWILYEIGIHDGTWQHVNMIGLSVTLPQFLTTLFRSSRPSSRCFLQHTSVLWLLRSIRCLEMTSWSIPYMIDHVRDS